MAKIVISVNTSWNLVNFRAGLIRALIAAGHEVVAVAPRDQYSRRLPELGCRYVPLPMDNKGTHPGRDLVLLLRYLTLLRAEMPDVYLGYTIKPNVYGSLAAHLLGIPVINNVAGLGSAFSRGGWLALLVRKLYRSALSRSSTVFFQNEEDKQQFVSERLVDEGVADRLPGSGVDLERFSPTPLPNRSPLRFLLVARLIWDKGIGEYVEAARMLKKSGCNAEFCILGFLNVENPSAIPQAKIDEWVEEGSIRYLGSSDDIRNEMSQSDCVVLPSYYPEGTPRVLLEAAAMARPIVTTNSVGCRNVVVDGSTGYLCCPKDASDLADKIRLIASLSSSDRHSMGQRGRELVEREFDESIVIRKYLESIEKIVGESPNSHKTLFSNQAG